MLKENEISNFLSKLITCPPIFNLLREHQIFNIILKVFTQKQQDPKSGGIHHFCVVMLSKLDNKDKIKQDELKKL